MNHEVTKDIQRSEVETPDRKSEVRGQGFWGNSSGFFSIEPIILPTICIVLINEYDLLYLNIHSL